MLNSVALLEMSSRSWCSPSAWPRSAWHPDAHRGSAWMVTCAQVTHLSAAGVWPYGANGGMHTPKAWWGGEAAGTQSCPCSARGDIRTERRNELIKMALQPPAGTPAEADCVQCVTTRAESSPAPTVI